MKFSKDCKYVMEGNYKQLDSKTGKLSRRHFFLFSDMILIAKSIGKKYKLQTVIPLDSCIIWDVKEDSELRKCLSIRFKSSHYLTSCLQRKEPILPSPWSERTVQFAQ